MKNLLRTRTFGPRVKRLRFAFASVEPLSRYFCVFFRCAGLLLRLCVDELMGDLAVWRYLCRGSPFLAASDAENVKVGKQADTQTRTPTHTLTHHPHHPHPDGEESLARDVFLNVGAIANVVGSRAKRVHHFSRHRNYRQLPGHNDKS